jgi:hypothetical protein
MTKARATGASTLTRAFRLAGILAAAGILAVACSSSPKSPSPSIGLGGEKKSLKALDGRWEGTYTNPVYNRTGSIVFEVFSGGEEAHGDILMVPPGAREPLQPSRPPSPGETLKTMPRILEISFVEATGDELQGNVEPFVDPQCLCDAHAVFRGTISGDTLQGTFFVEYLDSSGNPDPGKPRVNGTWKMARVKKG